MRQGQNQKRARGRGRKNHNGANKTLDSNGPDVKIRGSAAHICEKYQSLARDAHASGDRISAENYLQHAEHYYRILAANQTAANGAAAAANGAAKAPNGAAEEEAAEETADANAAEAPKSNGRGRGRGRSSRAKSAPAETQENSEEEQTAVEAVEDQAETSEAHA